jgi:hypothetical protein
VKTFTNYLDLPDGGFSSGHDWGILGGHPGQAKRRAIPYSDVDIAILIHRENIESAHLKRIEYLAELGKLLKKDIHPVIMNTAGEELLRQIFSTGICILVNDQKVLSRFKTAAFSRIAAFSMYQTQFHKGFISSLKKEAGIG